MLFGCQLTNPSHLPHPGMLRLTIPGFLHHGVSCFGITIGTVRHSHSSSLDSVSPWQFPLLYYPSSPLQNIHSKFNPISLALSCTSAPRRPSPERPIQVLTRPLPSKPRQAQRCDLWTVRVQTTTRHSATSIHKHINHFHLPPSTINKAFQDRSNDFCRSRHGPSLAPPVNFTISSQTSRQSRHSIHCQKHARNADPPTKAPSSSLVRLLRIQLHYSGYRSRGL